MRLSMESAHEDTDNEEDKYNDKLSDTLSDNEDEENDFLAKQRHTSKLSNPASGKVSLQNSGENKSRRQEVKLTTPLPLPPVTNYLAADETVTDKSSTRSKCSDIHSATEESYPYFQPEPPVLN